MSLFERWDGFQILLDGYYICPRCKGLGYHKEYDTNDDYEPNTECRICDGDGCIDWVTYSMHKSWEEKELQLENYYQEVEEFDEYFDELEDQLNGSFKDSFSDNYPYNDE
jgi:hypothetical protein